MIVVLIVNCLVTATAVLIHYEALLRLTLLLQRLRMHHRYRILLGVFGALIAHTLEVWVFAIAYYYMHHAPG
jgi:hypothetical protein